MCITLNKHLKMPNQDSIVNAVANRHNNNLFAFSHPFGGSWDLSSYWISSLPSVPFKMVWGDESGHSISQRH